MNEFKGVILKTINTDGNKCKTYVFETETAFIFHKYTIIPKKDFENMVGGETIVRETENYQFTFNRFGVKKKTLASALRAFGYSSISK